MILFIWQISSNPLSMLQLSSRSSHAPYLGTISPFIQHRSSNTAQIGFKSTFHNAKCLSWKSTICNWELLSSYSRCRNQWVIILFLICLAILMGNRCDVSDCSHIASSSIRLYCINLQPVLRHKIHHNSCNMLNMTMIGSSIVLSFLLKQANTKIFV